MQEFLVELGLDHLPEEDKLKIVGKLEENYQKFFLLKLSESLSDDDLNNIDTFESINQLESYLESKNIDYKEIATIVAQEVLQFFRDNLLYLTGYSDGFIDSNKKDK